MDYTMSNWISVLKGEISKNDDFVEDFGFFNYTDISNWFDSLEQTFEQMLQRIGIDSDPDTLERLEEMLMGSEYKPKRNKKLSFNQREIKRLGTDIATEILQNNMEKFITAYSETVEDDSERSISTMLGSQAYTDVLEELFEFTEMILSTIFDTCYESVRAQYDTPKELDENEEDTPESPIDPDAELSDEIKEQIKTVTEELLKPEIDKAIAKTVTDITSKLTGDKQNIGLAVKDGLEEQMSSTQMTELIEDFTAYVFQSFWLKYPRTQLQMARSEVADTDEYTPDAKLEADDPEEYKRRRDDFERLNRSEHNNKHMGEFNWQSILSKESAVGLTSNAGFSPAIHNKTYSSCDECEDKKTPCGCGK